jgi:hypothetical protein
MLAHGFTVDMLVELITARLATAQTERMVAGGRRVEVIRFRITDAIGRNTPTTGIAPCCARAASGHAQPRCPAA